MERYSKTPKPFRFWSFGVKRFFPFGVRRKTRQKIPPRNGPHFGRRLAGKKTNLNPCGSAVDSSGQPPLQSRPAGRSLPANADSAIGNNGEGEKSNRPDVRGQRLDVSRQRAAGNRRRTDSGSEISNSEPPIPTPGAEPTAASSAASMLRPAVFSAWSTPSPKSNKSTSWHAKPCS